MVTKQSLNEYSFINDFKDSSGIDWIFGIIFLKGRGERLRAFGPMEEDKRKLYKRLMRYSAVGLEMGFAVAIGVAMGYYLDQYFNTSPWLILIFLMLGVVAAFRSLFSLMKDVDRNERRN